MGDAGRSRWPAAALTVLVAVAGCTPGDTDPPARTSPAGSDSTSVASPTGGAPEDRSDPLVLAPLHCRHDQLLIRPGPQMDEPTGGRSLNMAIRNVSDQACTLAGFPLVQLHAADGSTLAFRYEQRDRLEAWRRQPRTFIVHPHQAVFFQILGFRCDVSPGTVATSAVIELPGVPGALVAPVTRRGRGYLARCGQRDNHGAIGVTSIGASAGAVDSPANQIEPATEYTVQFIRDSSTPVPADLTRLAAMFVRYAAGASDTFPHQNSVEMAIGGRSVVWIDDIDAALSNRDIWKICPADWDVYGAASCPVDLLGPVTNSLVNEHPLVYSTASEDIVCAPPREGPPPPGRRVVLRPAAEWRTCASDFALVLVADHRGLLTAVDVTLSEP